MTPAKERFHVASDDVPPVRGWIHRAADPAGGALVLAHGASGTCESPLLVALAHAFAAAGVTALRCDLAFRVRRPKGPPSPSTAGEDRESLRRALTALRSETSGRISLGGHSYGGRQASMLVAEDPTVADALLLLSYPLHPPGRPQAPRTAHLPRVRVPTLLVHGTKDPFGSVEEVETARALIAGPNALLLAAGAGHDLARAGRAALEALAERVVVTFLGLARSAASARRP